MKLFDPMTATDEEFAEFNRLPEKERDRLLEANATACRLTEGCKLWNMHKGACRVPSEAPRLGVAGLEVLPVKTELESDLLTSCEALLALVALKYGNLDPDVNTIQRDARAAISKARSAR